MTSQQCLQILRTVKDVAFMIQHGVKKEIEAATRFKVKRINVHVIDVDTTEVVAYKQ